jgi:hypothetical protein
MSLQAKETYFKENLAQTIIKPLVVGGLITGYRYFIDKERDMRALMVSGAIGAGASFGSRALTGVIKKPSHEGLKAVEHMVLEPVMTGAIYTAGRMIVERSRDPVKDAMVGVGSSIVGGYISSPIDRFF